MLRPDRDGALVCPESGYRYQLTEESGLRCLDLAEDAPLPAHLAQGSRIYDDFKQAS
jgi:UDP-2-acetamido-3-amino-2,3-dideoxy-glucuronate N-acetyltransferase